MSTLDVLEAGCAELGFSARQAHEFAAGRAEYVGIGQRVRHRGAPPTDLGVLPTNVGSGDV